MNTIVMNAETLAVTEYTTAFTGLSGDLEATTDGLFRVGGSTDAGSPIESAASLGTRLIEGARRARPRYAYIHGAGSEHLQVAVTTTDGAEYLYPPEKTHDRTTRFLLGRGIRDNYLCLVLSCDGGGPFQVDQLSFELTGSDTRRL